MSTGTYKKRGHQRRVVCGTSAKNEADHTAVTVTGKQLDCRFARYRQTR